MVLRPRQQPVRRARPCSGRQPDRNVHLHGERQPRGNLLQHPDCYHQRHQRRADRCRRHRFRGGRRPNHRHGHIAHTVGHGHARQRFLPCPERHARNLRDPDAECRRLLCLCTEQHLAHGPRARRRGNAYRHLHLHRHGQPRRNGFQHAHRHHSRNQRRAGRCRRCRLRYRRNTAHRLRELAAAAGY